MTYYPDLAESTMIDAGPHIRAIGWLDNKHPFPVGDAPVEFVQRLRELVATGYASIEALGWGVFMGGHTCELCHGAMKSLNLGVPAGDLLYVAPEMIGHYVEKHRYLPPPGFIEAVLKSPLPGTPEYSEIVSPFRDLHREYSDRQTESMYDLAARNAVKNGADPLAIKSATLAMFGNDCDQYCNKVTSIVAKMLEASGRAH